MEAIGFATALIDLVRIGKEVSQYLGDVVKAPEQSKELCREISLTSELLVQLQTELTSSTRSSFITTPTLKESLAEFRGLLTKLNTQVNEEQTKGIKQLKWPFKKDETERYLLKVQRYKASFSTALEIKAM
jgi:hypothetical protein